MRSLIALTLALALPGSPLSAGEVHVVPLPELHQRLARESRLRQERLRRIEQFFASQEAAQALKKARLEPEKIRQAVALLSDEELARLAGRVDHVQADIAGGALSNQQLTYIVIALGTAVIILVILAAGD